MKEKLEIVVAEALEALGVPVGAISIERPADSAHGDYSTNTALVYGKKTGVSPREFAGKLVEKILETPSGDIEKIEVAGAGFINFFLTSTTLEQEVFDLPRTVLGNGEKINIEFISTNPTGELHIGHGRSAFFGDTLARVLTLAGRDVTREFYINDSRESNQIRELGKTALGKGEQYKTPELEEKISTIDFSGMDEETAGTSLAIAVQESNRKFIEEGLGVKFDMYFSEDKELRASGANKKMLERLKSHGFTYESDGAVWLKTTEYGDDEDRVIVRSDLPAPRLGIFFVYAILCDDESIYIGQTENLQKRFGEHVEGNGAEHTQKHKPIKVIHVEEYRSREEAVQREKDLKTGFGRQWLKREWKAGRTRQAGGTMTYFVADIAYHQNKFDRGFETVIDVMGADHHGHVKRMQAVGRMLGWPKTSTNYDQPVGFIAQMVSLKEDGVSKKMSKRAGNVISLRDLVEEFGIDIVRWFFNEKALSTQMTFDMALAHEQSEKNPVFYVQYAHARLASIIDKAKGESPRSDLESADSCLGHEKKSQSDLSGSDFADLIKTPSARALASKITEFPEVVSYVAREYTVQSLTGYASALATFTNAFYRDVHIVNDDGVDTSALALAIRAKETLADTLSLLGISAPERM